MHNEKTIPFFGELNESQDQAFKSEAKRLGVTRIHLLRVWIKRAEASAKRRDTLAAKS